MFQLLQIWDPDSVRQARWKSTGGAKVRLPEARPACGEVIHCQDCLGFFCTFNIIVFVLNSPSKICKYPHCKIHLLVNSSQLVVIQQM